VVAGSKPWSRRVFTEVIEKLPGQWDFIQSPDNLNIKQSSLGILVIFSSFIGHGKSLTNWFPPMSVWCFHMTDVPYGRGGRPIAESDYSGIQHTKLTALRMTSGI